jgi:hypothetical protein
MIETKKSSETVPFINTGSYGLDAAHITLVGKNLWLDSFNPIFHGGGPFILKNLYGKYFTKNFKAKTCKNAFSCKVILETIFTSGSSS